MSTVPDPATTNWVPLQGRPSGAAYFGQWSAASTYYDGDCVIATDGVLYMCVTDGTTAAPVAWPGAPAPQGVAGPQGPQGIGVPSPVVNGQWIKGVGGAAVWSAFALADMPVVPSCRVWSSTAGSIPTSTYGLISGYLAHVDYNSAFTMYDNGVGVQTPGVYLFEGKANFPNVVGGSHRLLAFSFNGTAWQAVGGVAGVAFGGGGTTRMIVTMVRRCVNGDYVNMYAYQDSGVGIVIGGDGPGGPELTATWLGRGV